MSPKGDAAILAIMGGPKPKKRPTMRSPIGRPTPKGFSITMGKKPMENEDEGLEDEDEALVDEDEDREMIVADLESALQNKDAEALYDAIKACVLSVQGGEE